MKKVHYCWTICAVCTLQLLCVVGLSSTAYGIYQPYVIAVNRFTNTQASFVVLIRSISSLVTMLLVDKAIQRFGVRICSIVALLLESVGFGVYGLASSVFAYCIGAVIVGTAYSLGGMVTVTIVITKWFDSRRGLTLGICSAGTGVATMLVPPMISMLIEHHSLRFSYLAEAGFILFSALIVIISMKEDPEECGSGAYHIPEENVKPHQAGTDLPESKLRHLAISTFLLGAIGSINSVHVPSVYISSGFAASTVAWTISLEGLLLTISKFIYGQLTDRWGTDKAIICFFRSCLPGKVYCSRPAWGSFGSLCSAWPCSEAACPLQRLEYQSWRRIFLPQNT